MVSRPLTGRPVKPTMAPIGHIGAQEALMADGKEKLVVYFDYT